MLQKSRPAWVGYAIALVSVAFAAALRAWLYRAVGDRLPFVPFLPALIAAAWCGGLGPGLLAVALSTLAAAAWIERPGVALASQPLDLLRLALFFAVGAFGVWLIDRFRAGRQRSDQAAAAQARLAAIVESSDDAIFSRALDGTIQSWNAAAARLFGYTAEEAVGRPARMLFPADRAAEEDGIIERLARGESVGHYETVRVRKDGVRVEVAVAVSPIRDAAGRVVGASTIARDVSERRRLDEARRMGEFRFQRLVEQSPLSTQLFAPDGTCRQVNRAWERLWGITLADIPSYNVLHDAELERLGVLPLMRRAFAGEAVTIDPIPYVLDRGAHAGRPRWAGAYVYPVKDDAGRVAEVVLVHNDVTEQRLAQEALRASEQRLRSLVEQSAAGIAQTDLTGRIQFANERYGQIVGYPPEQVVGLRVQDLTHPEDRAETARLVAGGAETGREYSMEKRYVHKDGSVVWVAVSASIIKDEAGRPQSIMGVVIDVSDRRRAEEQLRRSHDTFYHLIQNDPFGVYVVDADFRLREVSAGAQKVFQHVPRPLIGRDFAEVLRSIWAEPFAGQAVALFRRTLETGEPYASPRTVERRGDTAEVEAYDWRIERVMLPDGRFGVVCYFYDLSERQQYEAAIRQGDERLRLAVGAARMVVWEFDPATGQAVVLESAAGQYGLGPGGTLTSAEEGFALVHPDDVEQHRATFERAAREGTGYVTQFRMVRKDNAAVVWVEERAHAVRDEAGNVVRLVGVRIDITDRKRIEERLRTSEERLALSIGAAELGTFYCPMPLGRIEWNDKCKEHFWLPPDAEIDFDLFYACLHPDDRGRTRQAVERAVYGREPYDIEYRTVAPDGRQRWVRAKGRAYHDAAGNPLRFDGVTLDVTERRRAEDALRESERRFRDMADTAPAMLWVTEPDGYCSFLSRGWYEFTGQTQRQALGFGWADAAHPDDRAAARAAFVAANDARRPYATDFRVRGTDGAYRWVIDAGRPRFGPGGEFLGFIGSVIDITERKLAEEERNRLLDSERAARAEAERASRLKDEFLATLSHELRTPLNAILGYAQLLRRGPVGGDVAEGLEVIERNARVQTQIIEDLLEMSRIISGKLRLNVQSVDVADVVRAAAETVRPAADAKGVRLQVVLDPAAGPVSGDPARLQQAVWNLLSNAIKFTPKGGRVQAVLRPVNSHVEVAVSDTGQGIRPDFLPFVFERFRQADASTTRRHGGLGLGLSIVKSIVEMHGGTVQAMSPGEGCGATFVISLPLSVARRHGVGDDPDRRHPRAPTPAAPAYDPPSLAGVRVLVVDDEPDARELVRRLLEDCGAEVATAASADEALSLLDGRGADVILSDIGMPDVDGYEFIRRVRARGGPDGRAAAAAIPAAALTAFARSEDRTRALMAGYQTHIAKPVEPTELVAAVAALAGRTGN